MPVELGHQHADPHRPLGDLSSIPSSFSVAIENTSSLKNGLQVVHAGDVGPALQVRELLALLLHAGVQVADDRLAAQHGLALQLEHEPQHAVRAGVLRPHVDDHPSRSPPSGRIGLLIAECRGLGLAHPQHRADLAQQFRGGHFAAAAASPGRDSEV